MAFDTFDEGINPGGMRSKNEIKTLICYLYNSVKENRQRNCHTGNSKAGACQLF